MKTVRRLLQCLFWIKRDPGKAHGTKSVSGPMQIAAAEHLPEMDTRVQPSPIAPDDSPPGYKVRWYHKLTLTFNERKSHETRSPIPEPVALSQELQTKSYPPHSSGETAFQFSPGAIRGETTNQNV